MNTRLDHIVIAARSLEQGGQYIKDLLGVNIPDGGRHDMMATHNKVMSLGKSVYLEVIAIDPSMMRPDQPRWFGLDDPHVRRSIEATPRLLTWAVNTPDLNDLVSHSSVPLGIIKEAQRDDLRWRVAISEDGRMPGAGFIPLCIQWQVDFHPSERMQQLDCQIESLKLYHPGKRWLIDVLESINAAHLVSIEEIDDCHPAYMEMKIHCPKGEVIVSSLNSL